MDFSACLPKKGLENLEEEESDESEHNGVPTATVKKKPKKNSDWDNLRGAIIGLFKRNEVMTNVLMALHGIVSRLGQSGRCTFLTDWCKSKVFPQGANCLLEELNCKKGKILLEDLDSIWMFFFTQIVPMLEVIFYKIDKPDQLSIRTAALVVFRDDVVLKLDLLRTFEVVKFSVSPGIKHMLLILQNVHEVYPPSANRLKLEKLVARVIVPYLGFEGYYEGGEEPVVTSLEPVLVARRRSSVDPRRLDRPLSMQPSQKQLDYLTDVWRKAGNRSNSFNDV